MTASTETPEQRALNVLDNWMTELNVRSRNGTRTTPDGEWVELRESIAAAIEAAVAAEREACAKVADDYAAELIADAKAALAEGKVRMGHSQIAVAAVAAAIRERRP